MFNLIVSGQLKNERQGIINKGRVLEFTSDYLLEQYMPGGILDSDALLTLPTILMGEGTEDEKVWIGDLNKVDLRGTDYNLQYAVDPEIPPLTNRDIYSMASVLGIEPFEFHRNHWAIKEADLYKSLYHFKMQNIAKPKVFELSSQPTNSKLISFMMPFSPNFDTVYKDVKAVLEESGYSCKRADDMWVHSHIMTDILELICTSEVIICDLSRKNPNVFYEVGIAHSLGKEVILITQSHEDVPFDLRSIRYIHYLENAEGRAKLAVDVTTRIKSL